MGNHVVQKDTLQKRMYGQYFKKISCSTRGMDGVGKE